jgi:predicted phosphodiesterase
MALARHSGSAARQAARCGGMVLVAVALLTTCIHTSPYSTATDVSELTAENLALLSASSNAEPRAFTFAALGDTHRNYDDFARTIRAINARSNVEFLLYAGDLTDVGLRQEFEWTYDVLREVRVPFLTVIGNHDAVSEGATLYRKMFGPLDYAFTYAGVKFVMFNSNTLEFGHSVPNRAWLQEQLNERDGGSSVVLVTHQSPTNPDDLPGGDVRRFYRDLYEQHDILMEIHGHLRDYELDNFGRTLSLQCGHYKDVFTHSFVTIDGRSVAVERCVFEDCAPATPRATE